MSDQSDPSRGYAGPPQTGYGQPQQPVDPYAAGQQPGWGYQPQYPMAYPAAVYQPGYGQVPPGERRPGTLTAAAVLGYINAGFLIVMGVALFSTTSIIDNLNRYDSYSHSRLSTEFAIDAVLNLVAAGLLIGGAVAMTNRTVIGRLLYSVGATIVIGESIYWVARWGSKDGGGYLDFYALLFAAIAIIGLALAWVNGATNWLNRASAEHS